MRNVVKMKRSALCALLVFLILTGLFTVWADDAEETVTITLDYNQADCVVRVYDGNHQNDPENGFYLTGDGNSITIPLDSWTVFEVYDIRQGYRIKSVYLNDTDYTEGFVNGAYGCLSIGKVKKDYVVTAEVEPIPETLPAVSAVTIYMDENGTEPAPANLSLAGDTNTRLYGISVFADGAEYPIYYTSGQWQYSTDGITWNDTKRWGRNRYDFWPGWSNHEFDFLNSAYDLRLAAEPRDMYSTGDTIYSDLIHVNGGAGVTPLSIRYASKTIDIGTSFQFTATGGTGGYTWRVGNAAIAAVDSTGLVTGNTVGNTYLYCKDTTGNEVKCLLKIASDPLSIRYTSKTIKVSETFQFTATGGSGGYTWRVGNTDVASVGQGGKARGNSIGNTWLYCTDSAGNVVRCLLKIVPGPLSISYTEKVVIASPNVGYGFVAKGGTGVYTWRTDDPGVATVHSTSEYSHLSTVTGVSAGNTWLYCMDSAGTEVKCLLKSVYYVYIIGNNERCDRGSTAVGVPFQFTATGGSGTYTWRTGNSAVATVDATGKVTGVSEGNTYLYCRDSYGIEGKCLLKIVSDPLSIRYSEKTVSVGETFQFSATGGSGTYYWRTGNTSVATVAAGKVTGKTAGNTYLYCRDSYGNEVRCLLKIKA